MSPRAPIRDNACCSEVDNDDPWIRRPIDGWTFQILVGLDGFDSGPLDVEATSSDGRRFLGTVGTLAQVQSLLTKWEEDGDCLNGSYFFITDFVAIAESNADTIFAVMEHLATTGEIEQAFDEVTPDLSTE